MKYLGGFFSFLLIVSIVKAQEVDTLTILRSWMLNGEYRLVLDHTRGPAGRHSVDIPETTVPSFCPDFQGSGENRDSLAAGMFYYRGTAYRELSILDSSLYSYILANRLDPGNMDYLKAVGLALQRLGRTRDAAEVFEQVVREDTSDRVSQADLAALYIQRREYAKSLLIYRHLLERDSLNYYFLKQAGRCYLDLNLGDSALACFKKAFELNPADVYLTQQIANIYLRKKDLDNALYSIQKGFAYDTGNLDLLKLRGYLRLLSGEIPMAIRDLERAREQDTSSVFIQKYLGISYHEEKRFDEGRKTLGSAFQLDSTDAEIAYFLGSCCRWSKFEEEGAEYFKKSIELRQPDPKEIKNVYIQLAELYKVLHRFDEALDSYVRAMEQDPSDNTMYFKIGQVYDQNLNRKRTAIEYYEKYLSEGGTDQQLFNASEVASSPLEQHVMERIDKLKEDLFMEEE